MKSQKVGMPEPESTHSGAQWTFLTNHSHTLICLERDPESTVRSLALLVGITERSIQRILSDLEEAGAVMRSKEGRRNRYEVNQSFCLRHPVEASHTIGDLLKVLR